MPKGRSPRRAAAPRRRPAVSPRKWLLHLGRHLPVAVEGADPEGVHQVRVSAGRLAVWVELTGRRVLRDDLRRLRRTATGVRDADVLLERDLPHDLEEWLRARRERDRAAMLEAFASPHVPALRRALGVLPGIDREAAARALGDFRERVRRRGDAVARAPHDDEVIHGLRRAVRKLRYALDWVGTPDPRLKDLQTTLGDLNDTAVEARALEESDLARAHPAYAESLRRRLDARRRAALEAWRRYRASDPDGNGDGR